MYSKKGIIDRFEENFAVIQTQDKQTIRWEKQNLPPHLTEGSEVVIYIKSTEEHFQETQELAKKILDEVFSVEQTAV